MQEVHNCTQITEEISRFIKVLNRKGIWAVLMSIVIFLCVSFTGTIVTMSSTFTGAKMHYICDIPPNQTDLFEAQNDTCQMWNYGTNSSQACEFGYKFQPQPDFVKSSAFEDFQMICDKKHFDGMAQSLLMGGFFIGGIIGPIFADKYGRRLIVFGSMFVAGVLSVSLAFVYNLYLYLTINFILGILREISVSCGFIYGFEFVPDNFHIGFGILFQLLWGVSASVLGVSAYFFRHWRRLQTVVSVPIIICSLLYFIVPESPRWLIVNNKLDILERVINKYANRINRRNIQSDSIIDIFKSINKESLNHEMKTKESQYSPRDILRSPVLIWWMTILTLSWISLMISYYGAAFLTVYLPGPRYAMFSLLSSFEIPFFILIFFMLKYGRNMTLLLNQIFGCTAYIVVGFLPNSSSYSVVRVVLLVLGRASLAGSCFIIITTSVYIFPTNVRSFGTSVPSAISKLVSVLLPQFVRLYEVQHWLPTLIMGALGIMIAILNVFYPDWLHRPLPETFHDLRQLHSSIGLRIRFQKHTTTVEAIKSENDVQLQ